MRMLQRMMKDRETGVCEQGLVANPTARIFAENLEEAITIVLSPKPHVSQPFLAVRCTVPMPGKKFGQARSRKALEGDCYRVLRPYVTGTIGHVMLNGASWLAWTEDCINCCSSLR